MVIVTHESYDSVLVGTRENRKGDRAGSVHLPLLGDGLTPSLTVMVMLANAKL